MITNIKPIEYKGYLIRENDHGKSLILNDAQIKQSSEFIIKESIDGLEINSALGYNKSNLDILEMFTSIKHIRINNHTIDLKGLYFLKNLETLYLGEESNQEFDFSSFENLNRCSFSWKKKSESIFELKNLKWLSLAKFPFDNLENMSVFKNLEYLGVGNCKLKSLLCSVKLTNLIELSLSSMPLITSLEGINSYPNIIDLDFYDMKNLSNIESIKLLSKLKKLSFENCKNLGNINTISSLDKLEELYINNCDKIESLKPITNLNKITKLHFIESTNIVDGDLSPLNNKKIQSLYFQDRRHYSNKIIDFHN